MHKGADPHCINPFFAMQLYLRYIIILKTPFDPTLTHPLFFSLQTKTRKKETVIPPQDINNIMPVMQLRLPECMKICHLINHQSRRPTLVSQK